MGEKGLGERALTVKQLFNRIDRLRLAALLLWTLPIVALLPLGAFWLWQSEALSWWLLAMVACSAAGYGLQYRLRQRDRQLLADTATGPDRHWPPKADGAWTAVERLSEEVKPEDWPLSDGGRLWLLGQQTLETVARHYYPDVERPLLELTVPHALLIIERASRDLRATIAGQIPFSHRLTIGDLIRAWRWKASAERVLNVYRAGRLVINPADALLSEIWGQLRNRGYGVAWTELHRWLLREYVRKVGYYAIDLYSGRLILTDVEPTAEPMKAAPQAGEPLRILVLGRASAGKSSLINALFGRLVAATDVLPDTTATLAPYRLERDGLDAALIFDAPGCDSPLLSENALKQAALAADLVLWVCAAHRPDRQLDRERLDALRSGYSARSDRLPPPLLVAITHIDQLRPSREWQPPYDLLNPSSAKAANIRAAVEAVAADLAVPAVAVIPVCLADGRIYNVDDALWAAILERQDDANRARFLRCLEDGKRRENWTLLGRQLASAGRWLADLPGRVSG